jgi:hypothetical protein
MLTYNTLFDPTIDVSRNISEASGKSYYARHRLVDDVSTNNIPLRQHDFLSRV